MRPIPAPRLGDTHGLLRAINERERLRIDEFITEFSVEELFPPGLENALGRTRQFVSFARSAGLLKEDRGTVELTEIGKRYVRAGDADGIFDVAPDQAEWLRRQLRERHMTDSIYHGAAIGLSLYASNPPDFHVTRLDFGRALAYLGRAGWDNENTLESQGERYTTFLRDLELIDDESRLTETGTQVKGELTLPIHMSLRDLAGQLNPGGPDAAASEGESEWAARGEGGAAEAPAAEPAAPAEQPAPVPAAAAQEDDAAETGEYEEVRGSTAPIDPTPATPPPADRPVPPADIWETAAPDEATRAYSAISPEQAAAAAAGGTADEVALTSALEAADPTAPPDVESGDPLGAGAAPQAEAPAPETPDVKAGDPMAAGGVAPEADAPAPDVEAGDPMAAGGVAPEADAPAPDVEAGDPLAASGAAAAEGSVGGAAAEGDPLAATGSGGAGTSAAGDEGLGAGDPLAATGDGGDASADSGAAATAGAAPAAGDEGLDAGAGDPLAAEVADAAPPDVAAGDPLRAGGTTPEEEVVEPEVAAGDPLAPDAFADVPPEPEVITPAPEAVVDPPEPVGVEPVAVDGPGVESAAPEVADAEVVQATAAAPSPSARQPSGFLDMAAVRSAAEASGLDLPESVYANLVAALASGKHLVISGPAGSGKTTLALAVAKAAVQAGRSAGAALATASPKWSAHDTVGRVGDDGFEQGHVLASAGRKKWLVIDELDRAKLDKAFGDLSSFLGGLPLSLPDGSREVAAPSDWRIVATRDTGRGPLDASPALLRRFAQVHLPQPERADLERAIDAAADGDATAAAAVKRLLDADLPGLGAGAYLDAARHAAERNALSPASEDELADECMAAYIAPHLRQAEDGR